MQYYTNQTFIRNENECSVTTENYHLLEVNKIYG